MVTGQRKMKQLIFSNIHLGILISYQSKLFLVLIILLTFLMAVPTHAQGNQAYDLIDQVNSLRAANGLPPLQTDGSLMYAAQLHSEYQASIGSITHTGSGGSKPRDRAAAAGYGAGGAIFVSENIAGGASLSVLSVVSMWQGDSLHLNTMLSPDYTHIGAGVAHNGSQTYYTIDVGYIAGQGATNVAPSNTSTTNAVPAPGSESPPVAAFTSQIALNEQNEDGSIIHTVAPGQALEMIANAYRVKLSDILVLNNLSLESIIRPGDEIIIKPPDNVTKESEEETIILIAPTGTPVDIRDNDLIVIEATPGTVSLDETNDGPTVQADQPEDQYADRKINPNPIMIGLGIVIFLGTGLIIFLATMFRKA